MIFQKLYNKFNFEASHEKLLVILVLLVNLGCISCNKLVEIPGPVNTITTDKAFSNEANATAAVTAIYSDMSFGQQTPRYANGGLSIFTGMSADELLPFGSIYYFETNTLQSRDGTVNGGFWSAPYSHIYMANAAIEGLAASSAISQPVKDQLTGEAKFLRAFCYFYLVNLFGDVPLILSTDWAKTGLVSREPATKVYEQIIADLTASQQLLAADYAFIDGKRNRANKWAATALLSRVHLYMGHWEQAKTASSAVIEQAGLYQLAGELHDVFQINGGESILQLQIINQFPFASQEGQMLIPFDSTSSPAFFLTDVLLNAFEQGDQRRIVWLDSTFFDDGNGAKNYFVPFKYTVREGQQDNITQGYTLLRLAEQYLIRAEAQLHLQDLTGAIEDINVIRQRAVLPDLSPALANEQIEVAIAQERRIEFFAEFGHRWLDLKRTGKVTEVLSPLKPQWTTHAELYPIPYSELLADPNLTQNPGY